MRYEINIKRKSRGAIRNISGLNEEFQGMKLQFHRDGTPVSSHETPAHTGKNRPAFRNLSLLTLLLLFFSAGWNENVVWGQQYTITPQDGKTFPQTDIPTLVDTVYVDADEERTLSLGNYQYYYYFRWYREANNGTTIDRLEPNSSNDWGGRTTYLQEVSNNPSYFWYHKLNDGNNKERYVAQMNYTGNGQEDAVYCDLSFYVDGLGINPSGRNLTEPTISKRYMFYIKPASEMRERLNSLGDDEALKTVRITVPYGATGVNLQMDMEPESYYWNTNNQGSEFTYTINDGREQSTESKLITINSAIQNETTVEVYVNTGGYNDSNSPCITRFIITPQGTSYNETGFRTEEEIRGNADRNPADDTDKYQEIGIVDFDFDSNDSKGVISRSELRASNNMSQTPVDPSRTTYSFADPMLDWINPEGYMPEDAYGLYRSANVNNISERHPNVNSWGDEYDSNDNSNWSARNKTYGWYYTNINAIADKELYDRTYYNTDQDSCGYFYYVNASAEAGRVVSIPLNGILCPNTELIVTAWVADITDASTRPNVSLVLRGENAQEESVELHRFSSGEMELDRNTDRANWEQLCYRISITSEMIAGYTDFVVDFYNNTPNTSGGDYAIDDIRIYKTLPNIEVYRENACDAATLIVSTDYETILDNMGWTEGQDIITAEEYNEITENTSNDDLRDILAKRKYRYGLMGNNPDNPQHLNSVVGNVYFAFLSFDDKNNNGKLDADEESSVIWQSVNNAIVEENPELNLEKVAKAIRIAVPTDIPRQNEDPKFEFFTESREEAIKNGQIMNYRAIQDYNHDITYWQKIEGETKHPNAITGDNINPLNADGNNNPNFNEENYNKAIRTLYARLGIPRIRCPWYSTEGSGQNQVRRLYLGIIDVDNTDLKYQDEPLPDGGKASGEYWVVTFSAEQVVAGGEATVTNFDECTLMSPFTVLPATTITVETMTDATTALCSGAIRKITPTLNVYDPDTNEPVENFSSYIFDWYLGSEEEFKALSFGRNGDGLHMVIEAYRNRDGSTDYSEINPEMFVTWVYNQYGEAASETVKGLFDNGKLLTGTKGGETLIIEIRSADYIAMPYVWNEEDNNYVYCTDWTRVHFDITDNDIPDFYVGLRLADSPVALRLGLRHLASNAEALTIPISKALKMADGVDHFGLAPVQSGDENPNPVYVVINGVYTPVGQLTELNVPKPADDGSVTNATLTIKWNREASTLMHEGEQYILRIPFVQVNASGTVLDSQCDGLAYFPVKVVPEYLTWKGSSTDNWYDESKWNQSTEGEVYFDNAGTSTKDANGTDEDLTKAFSPLYFTKITIPRSSELALSEPETTTESTYTFLNSWADDDSDSIRYEMAVANAKGDIVPYYINKVSEIYFKPNATLLNQQYLTYDTARVEFNMTKGQSYWLASPLQGVYAGDMYAPSDNGAQETPAFKHISYNTTDYDRWDPAFYQKAWDKAITYSNVENPYLENAEAGSTTDVETVASNWSIEYNDVWVPYSIGKGFYARAEGKDVKVRWPKADTDYTYYGNTITRALSQKPDSRAENGKLAEIPETGQTTIRLTNVDGDGEHFLVGNPYMSYISMDEFFKVNASDENPTLTKKYWIVNNGVAEVGTPDIKWEKTTGHTNGYIAPMQAFFVERAGYNPDSQRDESSIEDLTITFTTKMMVSQDVATETTRSYEATNPQLTLTASSAKGKSRAAVVQSFDASNQYESERDAVTLLDSELDAPTVYTVAGNYAAAVNAVHDCQNIPLGVYAKDNEEVELTIEGASQLTEPLYLYDAVTRSSTPIEGDSYTLNLTGSSHGRYFLTTDAGNIRVESDIRIYSPNGGQLIIAASPSDKLKQVQIYDLSGRMVESRKNIGASTCQLNVSQGIYIVRVISEQGSAEAKLRIR